MTAAVGDDFAQRVESIAGAQLPVLLSDTCAVLDIVRDLTRREMTADMFQAAMALVDAMESKALASFLADLVHVELAANLKGVREAAIKALEGVKAQVKKMDEVMKVLGANAQADLSHFDTHMARADNLYERWKNASSTSPQSAGAKSRGTERVLNVKAPSAQGKDSLKDCIIFESYLDAAKALRDAGLTAPIVFLSPNVADYTSVGSVKADIQHDLDAVTVRYCRNFSEARRFLFGP